MMSTRPTPLSPAIFIEPQDQVERGQCFAVQGDGDAVLEADGQDLGRRVGGVNALGPLVDLFGRGVVRLFQMPAFDGAAPEVLVDGPDLVGGDGDGDVLLLGVLDLFGARVGVLAHGGDDGRVGQQGAHDVLDAELVVALAGAAVAEGVRADLLGDLDGLEADQGPGDGGGERVALVVAVGPDGGPAVVGDELGLGVGGVVFAAERLGAVLGALGRPRRAGRHPR